MWPTVSTSPRAAWVFWCGHPYGQLTCVVAVGVRLGETLGVVVRFEGGESLPAGSESVLVASTVHVVVAGNAGSVSPLRHLLRHGPVSLLHKRRACRAVACKPRCRVASRWNFLPSRLWWSVSCPGFPARRSLCSSGFAISPVCSALGWGLGVGAARAPAGGNSWKRGTGSEKRVSPGGSKPSWPRACGIFFWNVPTLPDTHVCVLVQRRDGLRWPSPGVPGGGTAVGCNLSLYRPLGWFLVAVIRSSLVTMFARKRPTDVPGVPPAAAPEAGSQAAGTLSVGSSKQLGAAHLVAPVAVVGCASAGSGLKRGRPGAAAWRRSACSLPGCSSRSSRVWFCPPVRQGRLMWGQTVSRWPAWSGSARSAGAASVQRAHLSGTRVSGGSPAPAFGLFACLRRPRLVCSVVSDIGPAARRRPPGRPCRCCGGAGVEAGRLVRGSPWAGAVCTRWPAMQPRAGRVCSWAAAVSSPAGGRRGASPANWRQTWR